MSKTCSRCDKAVYPTEELKCLDKVFFCPSLCIIRRRTNAPRKPTAANPTYSTCLKRRRSQLHSCVSFNRSDRFPEAAEISLSNFHY